MLANDIETARVGVAHDMAPRSRTAVDMANPRVGRANDLFTARTVATP